MVSDENINESPERRMRRITQLLANASVRLIEKGDGPEKENTTASAKAPANLAMYRGQGRIPFGKKLTELGWEDNELEMKWIRRIIELKGQGLTTYKIAKRLNAEDHETLRAGKWSRTAVWRTLKALDPEKKLGARVLARSSGSELRAHEEKGRYRLTL